MIDVTVRLREGLPVQITAHGHGPRGPDGMSAPCAAVSAVLKAVGLALVDAPSCTVDGAVGTTGVFDLTVIESRDDRWLSGLWDVTRITLGEISREWPREMTFTEIEENDNGS